MKSSSVCEHTSDRMIAKREVNHSHDYSLLNWTMCYKELLIVILKYHHDEEYGEQLAKWLSLFQKSH